LASDENAGDFLVPLVKPRWTGAGSRWNR
jgi:hypothetical protein